MNYENPDDIPLEALGEKWGLSIKQVVGLIGVPRWTSKIYLSLLEDGYTDEEVPQWFLRPAEEQVRRAQRTSEPAKPAETASALLAPRSKSSQTTRALGQGIPVFPGTELAPVSGKEVLGAPVSRNEVPGGPVSFTEQELAILQAERVTWIPAEARWMKVEHTPGGGYNKAPADPMSFLAKEHVGMPGARAHTTLF